VQLQKECKKEQKHRYNYNTKLARASIISVQVLTDEKILDKKSNKNNGKDLGNLKTIYTYATTLPWLSMTATALKLVCFWKTALKASA
jgi:hypothetical protein